MNVVRNEIRTGVLATLTLAALVAVLVYLGAPGAFSKQKKFSIYFDNAAGIKLGTPVMLAGRQIGQVVEVISPVPNAERPQQANEKEPSLEVRVDVRVDGEAKVYRTVKVRLASYGMLDQPVIDFVSGEESSDVAPEGMHFVGERPGGLTNATTTMMEKLDPIINKLTSTLDGLDKTADNVRKLTEPDADLAATLAEFRKLGKNLAEMTGPNSPLRNAVNGLERITKQDGDVSAALADFRKLIGPDSDLTKALANAEKFTSRLASDKDLPATLQNFRSASASLNSTINQLREDLAATARNLEQGSDTIKHQPWRLIWPSTKKYPEEQPSPEPKRGIPKAREVRRP